MFVTIVTSSWRGYTPPPIVCSQFFLGLRWDWRGIRDCQVTQNATEVLISIRRYVGITFFFWGCVEIGGESMNVKSHRTKRRRQKFSFRYVGISSYSQNATLLCVLMCVYDAACSLQTCMDVAAHVAQWFDSTLRTVDVVYYWFSFCELHWFVFCLVVSCMYVFGSILPRCARSARIKQYGIYLFIVYASHTSFMHHIPLP